MAQPKKSTGARKKAPARAARGGRPDNSGDAFLLNADGTVRVRWRDKNVLLWTPTIGEYEQILLKYSETRAWYGEEGRTWEEAYSATAPNAEVWALILELLGDNEEPIEAKDLPAWALTGDSLEKLVVHWRVNPLARGETQDLIQQVATNVVQQLQAGATTMSPDTSPAPVSSESAAS